MSKIRVAVCGASGRMGGEVIKAIRGAPDMELVGAIDIVGVGEDVGERCLGLSERLGLLISDDLQATINTKKPQVVVDFTTPAAVLPNIRTVLKLCVAAVVGTTGITQEGLKEIEELALKNNTGVVIAPNFSIGATLMMKFAKEAAKYMSAVEIIELHHDKKLDAPSGTSLRTAELILSSLSSGKPKPGSNLLKEQLQGVRGGNLEGIRIHSVRLPGLVAHQEVIFGDIGQILTIRHDSLSRESFIPGVLLAIRKVLNIKGLIYGLENLLG